MTVVALRLIDNAREAWKVAQNQSEGLVASFKFKAPEWNELLHPRGADGRFLSKGGYVKWIDSSSKLWRRGTVDNINSIGGKAVIKVTRSDGKIESHTANELYSAPAPKAKIPLASIKDMKKVGTQGGSTPGGVYSREGSDSKYYVKTPKTKAHAINEQIGHRLYEATGNAVPITALSSDDKQFVSKIEKSTPWSDLPHGEDRDKVMHEIRKSFAIDAWLANWDVPETDNLRVTEDGTPLRVDTGGALDYRAKGASKVANMTPEVKELKTLRDYATNPAGVTMYQGLTKEEEEDGVKRILALSPDSIKSIVNSEGGPDRLADDLIARRAWLAKHYGFQLPETTPLGKKIVEQHDAKTAGEDVDPPSLQEAVKKLKPGENTAAGVGSPIWLKDKAKYGKGLGDVWYITEIEDGKYKLKATKGSKTLTVDASDTELLDDNHVAKSVTYADGSNKPSIGDKVTLSNGEQGEVVNLYPKYAKVELPDGTKKTIAIVKLNLHPSTAKQKEDASKDSADDKLSSIEHLVSLNQTNKPKSSPSSPADDDSKPKPSYLYNKGFDEADAEIQAKYKTAAIAYAQTQLKDEGFEPVSVHTQDLIPTQSQDKTAEPTGAGPHDLPPVVLQMGNKKYLIDGHHRAENSEYIDAYVVPFKSPVLDEIIEAQNYENKVNSKSTSSALEVDEVHPVAHVTVKTNWSAHDWDSDPQPEVVTNENPGAVLTVESYIPSMPYVTTVDSDDGSYHFYSLDDLVKSEDAVDNYTYVYPSNSDNSFYNDAETTS